MLIDSKNINGWCGVLLCLVFLASCNYSENRTNRPNILIAIADDATYNHFGAYGVDWVETPAFDRVAREGVLFMNAYTPNAKCAPSRSTILTGRNSWQLEEAANHVPYFPKKFKTYPEVMQEHGYHVGYTGKGWAPGDPGTINGKQRQLAGTAYNQLTTEPPADFISRIDYAANFNQFMDDREDNQPFCFWYGGFEPHRPYQFRAGIEVGGKEPDQIDQVPAFWPDNDTVRTDMLDYAFEIEYFDKQLQKMLETLEERGQLKNTLVMVISDNGMPFPRVKGQAYEYSNHLPMAAMWASQIKNKGRRVEDFVSFIDIAPTFLEIAGITESESGMEEITGNSLTGILFSDKEGMINPERDHVLIGKERHDVGRPYDRGYPIRGIVTDNYLYINNFEPSRWPAGNPETGYLNTDGSPTKTWILDHQNEMQNRKYWQWSFGKRESEELYNLNDDPDCTNNLLSLPENEVYRNLKQKLRNRLFDKLTEQGDPRMFGRGYVFDEYDYAEDKRRNFYQRYMKGELTKEDAGWVNASDFEVNIESDEQ